MLCLYLNMILKFIFEMLTLSNVSQIFKIFRYLPDIVSLLLPYCTPMCFHQKCTIYFDTGLCNDNLQKCWLISVWTVTIEYCQYLIIIIWNYSGLQVSPCWYKWAEGVPILKVHREDNTLMLYLYFEVVLIVILYDIYRGIVEFITLLCLQSDHCFTWILWRLVIRHVLFHELIFWYKKAEHFA